MYKNTINREILVGEIRLAAKKGKTFKQFVGQLRQDYNIVALDTPEKLKELEYHYNTLCFMVGERKQKYNLVS